MSEKRNKRGEAGWIAEEIFEDAAIKLRTRCQAIDDQIARGVLDLEDALEVYEVSATEYLEYYISEQSAQMEARFHGKTPLFKTMVKIKYLNHFFHNSTRVVQSDLIGHIGKDMDRLEDDFAHGRVKVLSE